METLTEKEKDYLRAWRKEIVVSIIVGTVFIPILYFCADISLLGLITSYPILGFIKFRIIDSNGFCPVKISLSDNHFEMTVIKLFFLRKIRIDPSTCLVKHYVFDTKEKSYILIFPSEKRIGSGYLMQRPVWSNDEQEEFLRQIFNYEGITVITRRVYR